MKCCGVKMKLVGWSEIYEKAGCGDAPNVTESSLAKEKLAKCQPL